MSAVNDVENVRLYVAEQLASLGADSSCGLTESLLIHSGLFCGRRFGCDGFQVVWFIEEDEIKFFAPCGDLLLSESAAEGVIRYQSGQPAPAQAAEERRAA